MNEAWSELIPYKDDSLIMLGGFSDVYVATLVAEPRKVAVKVLRVLGRRNDDRIIKRLNREVYVLKQVDHPNVAKFLGVSIHRTRQPAIIMEWYKMGNASSFLRKQPNTSRASRLVMVRGLAKALVYLHTHEPPIVHGDIKGGNVLISDSGEALLTDFGLSKVLGEPAESAENMTSSKNLGTVAWNSPELFLPDGNISFASDVWAFACTVYELLTGRFPYSGRYQHLHPWAVQGDILSGILPFTEMEVVEDSPLAMWGLLERCWAWSASSRPDIVDIDLQLQPFYPGSSAL